MPEELKVENRPPPSAWVRRYAHLAKEGGTVLDVACGRGRNTRFFLDRGCHVTAIDRDTTGLQDLTGLANLEAIEADIESVSWPIAGRQFDLVVTTNYLYRPLLPTLAASVAPEGTLLYETFALGNEAFGRPRNPDFLLRPGELLEVFGATFDVVAYEHGYVDVPNPAIRQRIVAVASGRPRALMPP